MLLRRIIEHVNAQKLKSETWPFRSKAILMSPLRIFDGSKGRHALCPIYANSGMNGNVFFSQNEVIRVTAAGAVSYSHS